MLQGYLTIKVFVLLNNINNLYQKDISFSVFHKCQ